MSYITFFDLGFMDELSVDLGFLKSQSSNVVQLQEKHASIGLLLSMEYGRIWRQELQEMFRATKKEYDVLPVRPFIIRGLNQKKQIWKSEKPSLFRIKQ